MTFTEYSRIRRSVRTTGALLGTALFTIGVPMVLARVAGWPLPRGVPGPTAVATALQSGWKPDAMTVIKAFSVVAWIAWAQIGLSVWVEVRVRRRGGTTPRVPLATWCRPLAVRLAAVLLTVTPTVSPRLAGAAVPVSAPVAVAPHRGSQPAAVAPPTAPVHSPTANLTAVHVVCPGDTLWDLAKHHLNDPLRWRELFDINRGRLQPDGRQLVDPRLIRPGWRLEIPVAERSMTAPEAGSTTLIPGAATAPTGLPTARAVDAVSTIDAPLPAPPTAITQPAPSAPESAAAPMTQGGGEHRDVGSTGHPPIDPAKASPRKDRRDGPAPVAVVGVPTVLAGAFLGYLGLLRRDRERWRRRHHRFPTPNAERTELERAVRAIPEADAVQWIDLAMRHLAAAIAEDGAPPPPGVTAVRAGALGVEVLISQPWPVAPGRFIAVEDGHTWRLDPAVDLEELRRLAAGVPAYLPGLVTIGETEAGAVLLDLDEVGSLTVSGAAEHAVALLERLALELATLPWGDTLEVCLIGVGSRLRDLERVRIVEPDQALATLRRQAGQAAPGGLAAAASSDIPPGPTIAIIGPDAVPPMELADLLDLAQPHSGLAVVAAGPASAGRWRLAIAPSGEALLAPLALALRTSTDARTAIGLQDILMETASRGTDVPVEPIADDVTAPENPHVFELAVADAELDTGVGEESVASSGTDAPRPTVEVRVIGPIEITWPGEVPRPQVAEFVTYLATHPPSVGSERARLALWPATDADERFGERAQGTFSNITYKARRALGTDTDGEPLLRRDRSSNAFCLSDAVSCDWVVFRRLTAIATSSSPDAKARLKQALSLVRGRPFHDPPPGYSWIELERLDNEIEAAVVDAALDLCDLCLATDDIDTARWAVRQGQLCVPHSEPLLRAAMRVAAAAGDRSGIEQAWQYARRLAAELDACGEPEPATVELYRELRAGSPRGA